MTTAMSDLRDVAATPVAWREAGSGPLVVFLGGLGTTRSGFDPQLLAEWLKRRLRLFVDDSMGKCDDFDPASPAVWARVLESLDYLPD